MDPARTAAAYRHVRDIASGGMGRVSLVLRREGAFARVYAMKRLRSDLIDEGEVRAMFIEEARIAGLIRHANVVGVLDVGEDGEGAYLVMDYVEGISVSDIVQRAARREERIPARVCVEIARQAAEGLRAAHELVGAGGAPLRVVHRDVSPSNILVGFDGVARVTDFGVARALDASNHTRFGVVKGKRGYMSPEQIRCEPLDHRSDLFSLGIVLFEMLKGGPLYRGEASEVARRTLEEPPPDIGELRDDIPDALVALLFDLMAKKVEDRVSTTGEVVHRLKSIGDALSLEETDLAGYVAVHFKAERMAQRQVIAAALEDHDTTEARPIPDTRPGVGQEPTKILAAPAADGPRQRSGRSAVTLALAALVVSLALGGGALWVALTAGADTSAATPEPVVTPGPLPPPAPTMEALPAASTPPAEPAVTSMDEEVPPGVVEAPAPRPRTMRAPMNQMIEERETSIPSWQWD